MSKDSFSDIKQVEEKLKKTVIILSQDIAERNFIKYEQLNKTADFIHQTFKDYNYQIENQVYKIAQKNFRNIIATKQGQTAPNKIIIIGAHYDSVIGSPGADDNASGIAGLLILAELLSKEKLPITLKFIAFVNEEPPFFQSDLMGSAIYAKRAKEEKEDIQIMICLESIGYYSDKQNSQSYPPFLNFFYPSQANFIALVGNAQSAKYVKAIKKIFTNYSNVPMETLIGFSLLAPAIRFSDHDSFWKSGYKAVMLTDSAFYRTPYYHTSEDTYEKLDYNKMAQVIMGLYQVLLQLDKN